MRGKTHCSRFVGSSCHKVEDGVKKVKSAWNKGAQAGGGRMLAWCRGDRSGRRVRLELVHYEWACSLS